jgi:hypothetical protein
MPQPIGLLGASFEAVVDGETNETPDEPPESLEQSAPPAPALLTSLYTTLQSAKAEFLIFGFIFVSVALGIIQTVPEFACEPQYMAAADSVQSDSPLCAAFSTVEWMAVLVFSAEYALRLVSLTQMSPLLLQVLCLVLSLTHISHLTRCHGCAAPHTRMYIAAAAAASASRAGPH